MRTSVARTLRTRLARSNSKKNTFLRNGTAEVMDATTGRNHASTPRHATKKAELKIGKGEEAGTDAYDEDDEEEEAEEENDDDENASGFVGAVHRLPATIE